MWIRFGIRLGPVSSAVVALAVASSAACGGTDEPSPPSDDAAVAASVCGELKAFDNRVVRIVNRAVLPVHDQRPEERVAAMVDALGQVDLELIDWALAIDRLELSSPEADQLRSELHQGVDVARSEVADATGDLTMLDRLDDEDIAGGVGQLFTTIEKVFSEVEPSIAAYDREAFRRAFEETPDCRHVTQLGRP